MMCWAYGFGDYDRWKLSNPYDDWPSVKDEEPDEWYWEDEGWEGWEPA